MLLPRSPDYLGKQLIDATRTGRLPMDAWVGRLYSICKGTPVPGETVHEQNIVRYALDEISRDTVMAFVLSRCPDRDIEKTLELHADTVEGLLKLFYCRESIYSKLDHFEYIRYYLENYATDEGRSLIRLALENGPLALKDKLSLGYEVPDADLHYIAKKMFITSANMGLMARGNGLHTPAGIQAHKWFQTAGQFLALYSKLSKDTEDTEDALVAIERIKLKHRPEDYGLALKDVMH